MQNTSLIALSRQIALARQLDVVANNVANINTAGFKSDSTIFQEYLMPGARANQFRGGRDNLLSYVHDRATWQDFRQGPVQQTGNPLDIVIQGKGFFQVQRPDGTLAYTRAGNFQMDRDGNLVTADGNPIQPQITIPAQAQSITIAADGTVSYTQPGQTAAQVAGQLQIANFPNPGGLNSLGSTLFAPTDASGEPVLGVPGGQEGLGTLLQGYIEQSNVSVVDEFVNMIVTQRAYEANSKVVKAADEMYQQVNNIPQ